MKSTSDVKVTIKLEMELHEARWLQHVMQNPLWGDPSDEDPVDAKCRHDLFIALKDQTENHA